jgi:hypothetical protein
MIGAGLDNAHRLCISPSKQEMRALKHAQTSMKPISVAQNLQQGFALPNNFFLVSLLTPETNVELYFQIGNTATIGECVTSSQANRANIFVRT